MKSEFEEELNELSPFLADLKKQQPKEPFRTPRLYFDTLADKVLDKAKEETPVAVAPPPDYIGIYDKYKQRITLIGRINNWLSTLVEPKIAWSVLTLALIFSAGWYVINQQKAKSVDTNVPETVLQKEVRNYINDHIDEFKEEDIQLAYAETKPSKHAEMDANNTVKSEAKNEIEKKGDESVLPKTKVHEAPRHPDSGLTEEELEEYLNEHPEEYEFDVTGGKL